MASSLDTLPTETQLHIFRLLVPSDPDEPRRTDLGHLRLTCKAILPSANEIYFEHYYCLLWMRNGAFVESRSLQLLREKPEYAALVKTAWVALAAAYVPWLRNRATFGYPHALREEDTVSHVYKHTLSEKSEVGHDSEASKINVPELEFTLSETTEIVRTYHRHYIAPPAYEQEYLEPSLDQIEEELEKRFALLSNVRRIRLERALVKQTPFYTERLDFWIDNGFGEWAEQLAEASDPVYPCSWASANDQHFPWNTNLTEASLAILPPTCNQLQMGLKLFVPRHSLGRRIQNLLEHSVHLHTHLESLHLLIALGRVSNVYSWKNEHPKPNIASFTSKFKVLNRLELRWEIDPMTRDSIRSGNMGSMSLLLPRLSIPHLRHLSLSRCVLNLPGFNKLGTQFPRLRVLCVEEVAIRSSEINDLSKNLWYRLAKHISNEYEGNCILNFEKGPFIEFHGDDGEYNHVLGGSDPITRVLKAPILEVLTSISQSEVVSTDLDKQYWDLVAHETPDLPEHSKSLIEWSWIHSSIIKEVESPGMTFIYFDRDSD